MSNTQTINTQIKLPIDLYQVISQQAEIHGQSINSEIVSLLSTLVIETPTELEQEFAVWEAASDEDWLNLETKLISEEV